MTTAIAAIVIRNMIVLLPIFLLVALMTANHHWINLKTSYTNPRPILHHPEAYLIPPSHPRCTNTKPTSYLKPPAINPEPTLSKLQTYQNAKA